MIMKHSIILLSCLAGLVLAVTAVRAQERLDTYALRYLGQPYVEHALEAVPERLVIDTASVDCTTLVEYCLARRMADAGRGSFEDCVARLRYRNYVPGQPLRYTDRLHYATQWAAHAEALGVLQDLSLALDGRSVSRRIRFMSAHPQSYAQLSDPESLRLIRDEIEAELSARPFTYIPKDRIRAIERDIRSGDIILFTTSVDGLDVSHMAIAHVQPHQGPDPGTAALRPKVGFIHASSAAGKVMIDPRSIADYAASRSSITGIKVLRPL